MRYFIEFSYLGTNYHGWQIQPNAITVQEVLQKKMSVQLGEPIKVMGAGRTDAGVHAKQMFAHFDLNKEIPSNYIFQLNAYLPVDIAIHSIKKMKDDAHARFDAIKRSYQYKIQTSKNPFNQDQSWQLNQPHLDIKSMNACAKQLLSYADFSSFARIHTDVKTHICDVSNAQWKRIDNNFIFEISADRFLRNMVRAIVGTLVEVGKGNISKNEFIEIIEKKDRSFASASAPAQGLFLTKVQYPDDIFL